MRNPDLLEEAFIKAGMPYRLVGAQRFYGRREVKDVIAYLRLVHNPADEVSLARVINVPQRQIGDKTLQGLIDYARQLGVPAGMVLLDLPKGTDSPHWNNLPERRGESPGRFWQPDGGVAGVEKNGPDL